MRGLAWSVSHVLSCQSLVESYERGKSKCKRRELVACGVIADTARAAARVAVGRRRVGFSDHTQISEYRQQRSLPVTVYALR